MKDVLAGAQRLLAHHTSKKEPIAGFLMTSQNSNHETNDPADLLLQ